MHHIDNCLSAPSVWNSERSTIIRIKHAPGLPCSIKGAIMLSPILFRYYIMRNIFMFVEIFHRICCRWSECFFKVKIKFSREKIRKHFWQVQEEILELSQVWSRSNLKKQANELLYLKVNRTPSKIFLLYLYEKYFITIKILHTL